VKDSTRTGRRATAPRLWTLEPWIILLLRKIAATLPPDDHKQVRSILQDWDRKESVSHLRQQLGVSPSRAEGRRRTRHAARKKLRLLLTHLSAKDAGRRPVVTRNAVTIAPKGSDQIDTVNGPKTLTAQFESIRLRSDGVSNWYVL